MLSFRLGLVGRKMILNSLNGIEFYRNSLWGRYMFLQIFGTFSKVLPCYHHERDSKQKPLLCICHSSHVQIHLISSKSFQAPALFVSISNWTEPSHTPRPKGSIEFLLWLLKRGFNFLPYTALISSYMNKEE